MDDKKYWLAALALVVLLSAGWAYALHQDRPNITVTSAGGAGGSSAGGSGGSTNASGGGGSAPPIIVGGGSGNEAKPIANNQKFGAFSYDITEWTAGKFTTDLLVDDDIFVTGDVFVSGTISNAYGGTVLSAVSSSFSNATNTICTVQNDSPFTRTLIDLGIVVNGSTVTGSIPFIAGTSTISSGGNSPDARFIDLTINPSSTVQIVNATNTMNLVTTSTASWQFGRVSWRPNEWLFWRNTSSTGNTGGTCRALYY